MILQSTMRQVKQYPILCVKNNDLILSNFIWCYVEDYMIRNVDETLLLLIPTNYYTNETSKWGEILLRDIKSTQVEFIKEDCLGYMGVVATNPIFNNVLSGIYLSDYESEFRARNYGCSIISSSAKFSTSIFSNMERSA